MNVSRKGNAVTVNKFTDRVIFKGEMYGLNGTYINDKGQPLIEFYDNSQGKSKFDDIGKFVSRCLLSTIKDINPLSGFDLQNDVPEWYVSRAEMKHIKASLLDIIYYNQPKRI